MRKEGGYYNIVVPLYKRELFKTIQDSHSNNGIEECA
jgi:hypothetical protein